MLQLKNGTPFKGTIMLMPDPDGIDSLYTVVKGTFTLGERVALADEQLPVAVEQQYHGDPFTSSIRVPSDVSLMKPGTDVLLLGSAHAPGGHPTTQMDVSLVVGPLRKRVRVLGNRVWRSNGPGYSITPPEPFQAMPLVWERAFGGTDRTKSETREELRNPVGVGFRAPDGEKPLDGLRLPNLEDPAELISSWKQTPPPACFAPIGAHWEPRRSYAGTYDERWQQERAPHLPTDFDPRFFQLAPPGLVATGYLKGGEPVEVHGATRSGVLRFRLPVVQLSITYVLDGAPQLRPAVLDTVIIEPDAAKLQLVWRAVLPCDKKALRVSEVRTSLAQAQAA
jgi:hypothetical protein